MLKINGTHQISTCLLEITIEDTMEGKKLQEMSKTMIYETNHGGHGL